MLETNSTARRVALRLGKAWALSTPTERGGYRIARAVRQLIPRDQWSGSFEIAPGRMVQLDLACYPDCSMAIGAYELDTVRLMRRLLRPGDHFIDVGANIGYLSLMAAVMVGSAGRVDAIEPTPVNFKRLSSNVRANRLDGIIHPHRIAASDRDGELTLHIPDALRSGGNHGMISAYLPEDIRCESVQTPCVRLDLLFSAATPALVKMDVEGGEPLVVAGMKNLLQGTRPPHLILEVSPETARNAGYPVEEAVLLALALQPAYQVWTIGWASRRLRNPVDEIKTLGQANVWLRSPSEPC